MRDLISRQAAIDAVDKNRDAVFCNSVDYEGVLYDISNLPPSQPEVLACGEGELSAQPEDICSECDAWNVYKNYAQPEIIRCKDCKFNVSRNHKCLQPDSFFLVTEDDFYCGYAERRTDDPD